LKPMTGDWQPAASDQQPLTETVEAY
jgi:hypothetical protein